MGIPRKPLESIASTQFNSLVTFPSSIGRPRESRGLDLRGGEGVHDGIELVQIERQNSGTIKILSPGREEKEVLSGQPNIALTTTKALPKLPPSRRRRFSFNTCVIIILVLLFVLCLSLIAITKRGTRYSLETRAQHHDNF